MSDGDDSRSGNGVWARVLGAVHGRGTNPDQLIASEGKVHPSKVLPRLLDLLAVLPTPVIVDLGPVIGANVSFLGDRLGCKLHVEDMFGDVERLVQAGADDDVRPMLAGGLDHEPDSVDAVLAWDLFDYLTTAEAAVLIGRIERVLRPRGLVMALFTTAHVERPLFRKYVIEGADRLRHRWLPFARPPQRVLLARDVERLFAPLEVAESYLLTHRQRESMLRRSTRGEKGPVRR